MSLSLEVSSHLFRTGRHHTDPDTQHVDVCLPISGLKALVLNDGSRLILQGQGPYSRLIDERSGKLLAELRTFKRNNVHGFLILRRNAQVEWKEEYVQVICWGGQSLRVIDLVCSNSKDGNEASFSAASAEYLAPDWILSGCVSDSVDGEGSGGRAFLVTAHNALLGLDVMDVKSPKYGKGVYLQQLATGVKSILYSADTVALSPTHILIAAGTVFGEIIVWSCFLDENGPSNALSSIHHFFTGHEGSIFGIRISPEIPALHSCDSSGWLLASCSDDRTVRIWDISDCGRARRQDTPAYSTDGFELRSTGFGAVPASDSLGSESCLAKAFGHMARIWGVYFFPTKIENGQNRLRLASRGEDATCLIWDLSWEKSHQSLARNFQLRQTSSFHHHTGKHIWSLDMVSDDADTVIYTGGADGALKILRINGNKKETFRTGEFACKEDSLTAKSTHVRTDNKLKAFSFVARDCFLAISVGGAIQLGWIASEMTRIERGMKPHVTWETLCVEEDLRSFSVVSSLPEKGLALLGNAQGLIRLYDHKSKSLSTIVKTEQRPLGLYALQPESDTSSSSDLSDTLSFVTSYAVADTANLFTVKEWESSEPHISQLTLTLPPTFNNVTCASFICGDQYLALGSALGALAIYRLLDLRQSLQPLITIRRMHGKAGVNEVIPMSSTPYDRGTSSLGYFLTCGRDGDYCVHEMKATNDPEKPVSLETVHRSSASPCQNVVGVYFDKISHDLMLYGFRSSEFVLWNESTQSEVVSIECGGTRRSWAFHPSDDTANSGLFLWNKTSDFNALCIQPSSHRALRAGGHGREIKSMAVYNAVNKGRSTLFATGAEDTTVRIFAPADSNTEGPWGAFKCLRVLNNHGAGLQQVSWSTDGEHLFTSAGYGEFFVWRVRSIPRFGVAAVLMASSPKDDPKSDLRVTSFDVLDVEGQGGNPDHRGFLICLTFSNSTIEVKLERTFPKQAV